MFTDMRNPKENFILFVKKIEKVLTGATPMRLFFFRSLVSKIDKKIPGSLKLFKSDILTYAKKSNFTY